MEGTFLAFAKLWRSRNSEHIALSEIEAYARLFSIPDQERFAELILAADDAVWKTQKEVAEKTKQRNKLKKLKGR